MKTRMRRTLWSAAALAALLGSGIAAALVAAEAKRHRRVDVSAAAIAIPGDAAAIARGEYLFKSRACIDCHGVDGAGRRFVDDGGLVLQGPKIGPGAGSVTADYRADDWVRAIRHGVKRNGEPAMMMPSEDYNRLTDADLGALVAYLKQLPDARGGGAVLELPLPMRALYGVGVMKDAAAKIDHALPPSKPVPEGATIEHGAYVASLCQGCHGPNLSGGAIPGAPPAWPAAANLTPGEGSAMRRYADQQAFARMMRSGQRGDGRTIGVMPFEAFAHMNDVDLRGLYVYLQSLPPRAAGGR
jgi:mono/diheme cytochrome c family protein